MQLTDARVPFWQSIFFSAFSWVAVAIFTVFFFLTGLFFILPLSFTVDRQNRRLMHGVAVAWARSIIASNPAWTIRTEGGEHVIPGKHYVIIANHQSMLDILAVLAGLPVDFKFMAKKELMSVPFVGWHMTLAGYIPLDRSSRESGKRALLKSRDWLRKRVSVLMFPEGTRSLDGKIKSFKVGAFKLAQDESVEILPVVIYGTGDAVPKKTWKLEKRTDFVLSIGKPVLLPKGGGERIEAMKETIREEMIQRLDRLGRTGL